MRTDEAAANVQLPPAQAGHPLLPTAILVLLILTVQLVPSLPAYFGLATSMALGTMMAAGICIALVGFYWALAARREGKGLLHAGAGGYLLAATMTAVILLHAIIADQIQPVDFRRLLASLVPLFLLLGAAIAIAGGIRTARESQISTAAGVSFWVLIAVVVLKVTGLEPLASHFSKPTFPFTETSHFALALGPVYIYRCALARGRRRDLWLLFGLLLAVFLKSGSLLFVAFAAAVIGRRILVLAALGAVVAVVGLSVELKYFVQRADVSDTSSNLTALVYLEGWEMLDDSITRTHGWGVGFEQLGLRGTGVTAAETIRRLTGGRDLNLQDGGFVLAKLGSELGVLGFLLVLGYCLLAIRCIRRLRAGGEMLNVVFAQSVVVAYGVDMFVRGVGYFAESTLLFSAALLVLMPSDAMFRVGVGPKLERLLVLR